MAVALGQWERNVASFVRVGIKGTLPVDRNGTGGVVATASRFGSEGRREDQK